MMSVFAKDGPWWKQISPFCKEGEVWEGGPPLRAKEYQVAPLTEELVPNAHELTKGGIGPDGEGKVPRA